MKAPILIYEDKESIRKVKINFDYYLENVNTALTRYNEFTSFKKINTLAEAKAFLKDERSYYFKYVDEHILKLNPGVVKPSVLREAYGLDEYTPWYSGYHYDADMWEYLQMNESGQLYIEQSIIDAEIDQCRHYINKPEEIKAHEALTNMRKSFEALCKTQLYKHKIDLTALRQLQIFFEDGISPAKFHQLVAEGFPNN